MILNDPAMVLWNLHRAPNGLTLLLLEEPIHYLKMFLIMTSVLISRKKSITKKPITLKV